jgi:hypothetical protein
MNNPEPTYKKPVFDKATPTDATIDLVHESEPEKDNAYTPVD